MMTETLPGYVLQLLGAIAVLAYGIGSIPFGLLLTQLGGAGDIRAIGSGNIGATNVLRTGRRGLAAATLLLDGGKGAFAVLCGFILSPFHTAPAMAVAALFAVIGHCFPIWLKFKGGKGVATALGVLLGIAAAGLGRLLTAWGARRYARRLRVRLNAGVEEAVRSCVIEPVRAEAQRLHAYRSALEIRP